ncbi:LHFPL tetraspan subfamily member 6 protein-like [Centruroides vittatus]|uniref:LHFPL tetraspan subfamily member 6 protein-like n=1 Tax=Centruroides sculpturatus TaxID=218467 RepID=UPI000C6EC10D|nr:LHFPL tetraspan subfamily member 6 protein-like [Centruroides sculpturatus]
MKGGEVRVHVVAYRTSWPVAVVWACLSALVAVTCVLAFLQPEWFVRQEQDAETRQILRYDRDTVVYVLGVFGVCYRDPYPRIRQFSCHNFGASRDFAYFPSTAWQASCVLYGCGCIMLTCCGLLAFPSLWSKEQRKRRMLIVLMGHVQIAAVCLQTAALLLYPLVLTSHFGRMHCGHRSDLYFPDSCRLGWAYMLAITGTVLAYYCPFLARFSSYNVYSRCYWAQV